MGGIAQNHRKRYPTPYLRRRGEITLSCGLCVCVMWNQISKFTKIIYDPRDKGDTPPSRILHPIPHPIHSYNHNAINNLLEDHPNIIDSTSLITL